MKGKIISLCSVKGGVSKSTLALCLAHSRVFKGKTIIVDADPQGTIGREWAEDRKRAGHPDTVPIVPCYSQEPDDLFNAIAEAEARADLVFIDLPGESEAKARTRTGMVISDMVLVPLRPSGADMAAAIRHVWPLIPGAREANPKDVRFVVIATQVHHRARVETMASLFEGAELLPRMMPARRIYTSIWDDGQTLEELSKDKSVPAIDRQNAAKAIQDVDAIARALVKVL